MARRFEVIDTRWDLASGTPEQVMSLANQELDYAIIPADSGAPIRKDYTLRLVDHEGHLRGAFYDALEPKQIDSVISHIRLLQREFEQAQH